MLRVRASGAQPLGCGGYAAVFPSSLATSWNLQCPRHFHLSQQSPRRQWRHGHGRRLSPSPQLPCRAGARRTQGHNGRRQQQCARDKSNADAPRHSIGAGRELAGKQVKLKNLSRLLPVRLCTSAATLNRACFVCTSVCRCGTGNAELERRYIYRRRGAPWPGPPSSPVAVHLHEAEPYRRGHEGKLALIYTSRRHRRCLSGMDVVVQIESAHDAQRRPTIGHAR